MAKSEVQRFEDNFDKIVKYYLEERHENKLSKELMDQLERWKFVRMVCTSWNVFNKGQVARAVMKEFKVSEPTAYRDVDNAQRLFVRMEAVNREFERIVLIERLKRRMAKCEAAGDYKTATKCDENLIKIGGYDKELEPPKVVNNILNQLVFDPKLVGGEEIDDLEKVVKGFLAKKKKELDDEFAEDANVIEEEIRNAAKS